jgi:hypothetical protein
MASCDECLNETLFGTQVMPAANARRMAGGLQLAKTTFLGQPTMEFFNRKAEDKMAA